MSSTYPLLQVRGLETTTPGFKEQLVAGALAYGLNPNYIAAVIAFESGFNPRAKNPDGGALGLIQWRKSIFPASAKKAGMKIDWEDLPKLTAEEQLPLVFAYFSDKPIGETSSASDYYLSVFLPIGVGKPGDFVLGVKDSTATHPGGLSLGKIYELNRGLDKNPQNGVITVAKAAAPVSAILSAARGRPPLGVPLDPGLPEAYRTTLPSPGGVYSSPLPRPAPLPSISREDFGLRASGFGRGTEGSDMPDTDPDDLEMTESQSRATASNPAGAHDLPLLRKGDHGTLVCLLQRLLDVTSSSQNPDHHVVVDGEFGEETELSLVLHQKKIQQMLHRSEREFAADGICGQGTWSSFWQPWVWSLDHIGKEVKS